MAVRPETAHVGSHETAGDEPPGPIRPRETDRLPGGEVVLLAPGFVGLGEEDAERALSALAELLAAAAESGSGAGP